MYVYEVYSYPSIDHPINGDGSVNYGKIKYTGRWENGMKIGEGIFESDLFKIRVKTKHGLIYKCTEVLKYPGPEKGLLGICPLPSLKITKVGNIYKEEYSDPENHRFLFNENVPLFGGKAFPFDKPSLLYTNLGDIILVKMKDSNLSSLEFKNEFLKLYGNSLNTTPNGKFNINAGYLKIKANVKGHYINGPCIVNYPEYSIIYESHLNYIKTPVKVQLKSLKTELFFKLFRIYPFFEIEGEKKNEISKYLLEEIADSIQDSCTIMRLIIDRVVLLTSIKLISLLLVNDTDWKLFEQTIPKEKNYFQCFIEEKSSDKIFKILKNNERYEGGIVKGKLEGFGKYFYADGSVYVGEFKNNLRNGLGTFRFNDGSNYRGYWKDDLIYGKGRIINQKFKVSGVWERNRIEQGSTCTILEVKKKLD